jgi:hypothetical protein
VARGVHELGVADGTERGSGRAGLMESMWRVGLIAWAGLRVPGTNMAFGHQLYDVNMLYFNSDDIGVVIMIESVRLVTVIIV